MGMESFDVSFGDKNLSWTSHNTRLVPAKVDLARCIDAKCSATSVEGVSTLNKDRQRVSVSMECQLCTGVALIVLVSLHLLVMYELADIIASVYLTVLTPLISIFYNVSQQTQVHLYFLNLSAVVVMTVNVRYKRDFSFLFLAVLSGIQLHVLLNMLSNKRREEQSNSRNYVLICILLVGNGIVIYYLWPRSPVREYHPHEHALEALMLLLNACMYACAIQ